MKDVNNTAYIEGYVFSHKLREVYSKKRNQNFITGSIDVAVDEVGANVVTVNYRFITPTYKSGAENRTYKILKRIIEDENTTWIKSGKEAMRVQIEPEIAVNDFVGRDGEIVSAKILDGTFISVIEGRDLAPEKDRNRFEADMLITSVQHIDANPEREIEEHAVLKGAVFTVYRQELVPVEFEVYNPRGIVYFEDAEISNSKPLFTKVSGAINSLTVTREIKEESAFGELKVRSIPRKVKRWEVTAAAATPYEFGEDGALTPQELQTKIQDRNVRLAEVKRRDEEYKASRAPKAAPKVTNPYRTESIAGDFVF